MVPIAYNLVRITHSALISALVYATPHNFTHTQLYPSDAQAYLHIDAAQRLIAAAEECAQHGLRIKIWDAYRPLHMQQKMWNIVPDERYVANPADGGYHTRGTSLDITLVDAEGNDLAMPSHFDCFDERAHMIHLEQLPDHVRTNVLLLKEIMERHGFTQYPLEWWHFTLFPLEKYPVLDESFESLAALAADQKTSY